MEIRIGLPSDLDAEIVPDLDKDNNLIGLIIKPRFYTGNESKTYLWVDTVDNKGKPIEKFIVRISGNSGKSTKTGMVDQTEVVPNYYKEGVSILEDNPQHEDPEADSVEEPEDPEDEL